MKRSSQVQQHRTVSKLQLQLLALSHFNRDLTAHEMEAGEHRHSLWDNEGLDVFRRYECVVKKELEHDVAEVHVAFHARVCEVYHDGEVSV